LQKSEPNSQAENLYLQIIVNNQITSRPLEIWERGHSMSLKRHA